MLSLLCLQQNSSDEVRSELTLMIRWSEMFGKFFLFILLLLKLFVRFESLYNDVFFFILRTKILELTEKQQMTSGAGCHGDPDEDDDGRTRTSLLPFLSNLLPAKDKGRNRRKLWVPRQPAARVSERRCPASPPPSPVFLFNITISQSIQSPALTHTWTAALLGIMLRSL